MLSEERYDVRVQHTGHVKVNIPQFVTTLCRINIDLFPFDTQFCAIALASPLLNIEEMDVNATQPPRDSYFSVSFIHIIVVIITKGIFSFPL